LFLISSISIFLVIISFLTNPITINLYILVIIFISLFRWNIRWSSTVISFLFERTWNTPLVFLLIILILYCSQITLKKNNYYIVILLLPILTFFFFRNNILLLYISYEAILAPILLLILIDGSEPERLNRVYYIFLYTTIASLPLLISGISITNRLHSSSLWIALNLVKNSINFTIIIIITFLIKLPVWGLHRWLPLAHVYSPVAGRVLLAGILLKVGAYGISIVFVISSFSFNFIFWFISRIAIVGSAYCFFSGIAQSDYKAVIAFSSIIHIGIFLILILEGSLNAEISAKCLLFSHGVVSPILFRLVTLISEIAGTRTTIYVSGISSWIIPLAVGLFISLSLNLGLPPSLNFLSELIGASASLGLGFLFVVLFSFLFIVSGLYNIYIYISLYNNKFRSKSSGLIQHIDIIIILFALFSFPLFFLFN